MTAERFADIFAFFLQAETYANRKALGARFYGETTSQRLGHALRRIAHDSAASWRGRRRTPPTELSGENWVVIGTANQLSAMSFIVAEPDFVAVDFTRSPRRPLGAQVRWDHVPPIAFLPRYLPHLRRLQRCSPDLFEAGFAALVEGIGAYENFLWALRAYRPRSLVIGNDHNPRYRALALAARTLGIPTAYLPHASIGRDFPPLVCDVSLLSGQVDREIYERFGPLRSEVHLVGVPKLDDARRRGNTSAAVARVGIPYNLTTELPQVRAVLLELRERQPALRLVARPHPRDRRAPPALPEVEVSLPEAESAASFLAGVDAVVAPTTAILLEAALLNVYPIAYAGLAAGGHLVDSYGYLATGLADRAATAQELHDLLDRLQVHKPDVTARAQPYVATAGTEDEGRSAELALSVLRKRLTR